MTKTGCPFYILSSAAPKHTIVRIVVENGGPTYLVIITLPSLELLRPNLSLFSGLWRDRRDNYLEFPDSHTSLYSADLSTDPVAPSGGPSGDWNHPRRSLSMRNITVYALFVLLFSSLVVAQTITPAASITLTSQSSITVKIQGLSCPGSDEFEAMTWTFAVQGLKSSSLGGGGISKVSASDLVITKSFDSCSPVLYGLAVKPKASEVTIKQETVPTDDGKPSPIMDITLYNALIDNYQLNGNQSSIAPVESISFTFSKMCIRDSAKGGANVCYDFAKGLKS